MDQPSPKYKVFISSTTADLGEYRQAAASVIERLGHEPVMLELTVASNRSPVELSKKTIASCDLLISLLGNRYGFVPADNNPNQYSFVEIELRHAWEIGKPTLVFMFKEDTAWPSQVIERDAPELEQVEKLRKEALGRVVVGFFRSPDDLAAKVAEAFARMRVEGLRTADLVQAPLDLPAGVDPFELAWRLVVDFKAEPALLGHMDPSALLQATQQWAREAQPNGPVDGPGVFESAQAQLRSKQAGLGPSPLWVAWKRSTALKPQPVPDARDRA